MPSFPLSVSFSFLKYRNQDDEVHALKYRFRVEPAPRSEGSYRHTLFLVLFLFLV